MMMGGLGEMMVLKNEESEIGKRGGKDE